MKKRIFLILSIVLLFTSCKSNKEIVVKKVKKVSKNIYKVSFDKKKYPNANIVTILDKMDIKINKNNTKEIKKRVVKKIITKAGKKACSEFKIIYDKRYEKVEILKADIIKKNGKKVNISKKNIQVLDYNKDYLNKDFAIRKMIKIQIDSIEVGDIIDIIYIKNSNKEEKQSEHFTFASDEVILNKEINFIYPTDKEIKFQKKNFSNKVFESLEKIGDNKIYKIQKENLIQIIREKNMPKIEEIFPTIYYNTYKNWDEYANEIYDLAKIHHLVKSCSKKLSEKIVLKTDREERKVKKIENYLAKNIKLVPIYDLNKFEIREMSDIIKTGYGNSFERAILFKQMLDYQGIENRLIVLGPKENKFEEKKELLLVNQFNYIINEVKIKNKKYYIDTISKSNGINELEYQKRIGFPIAKKVEFIKIKEKEENLIISTLKGKIGIDKALTMSVENKYTGKEAEIIRKKYKSMSLADRKNDFVTELKNIALNVEPMTKGFILELGKNVTKFYAYKQNEILIKKDEFYYFNLPINIESLKKLEKNEKRKYDFENGENLKKITYLDLKISSEYEILEIPKSIVIENEIVKITRDIFVRENKIKITDTFELKEGVLKKEEYGKFYKEINELNKKVNRRVLLKERLKIK